MASGMGDKDGMYEEFDSALRAASYNMFCSPLKPVNAPSAAKAGQAHPAFSSAMKYYGTELNKRRHEILMSAGGVDALEWESERSRQGARPRAWLRTKANSIEGGTSEVMLGIVAKRILDLPGA